MAINDIVVLVIFGISIIGGFITGFMKSVGKRLASIGGIFASFYLGTWVCDLITNNIEPVREFSESNSWAPTVILIGSYIVVFIVFWILIRIIFSIINKALNETKALKVINKILGLVFGAMVGLILVDVYAWGLYGVSFVSSNVATWVIEDAQLGTDAFTFIKLIINYNLNAIGAVFPGLA